MWSCSRANVTIRTDHLSYDNAEDRVRARGNVQIVTAAVTASPDPS